MLPILIKKIFEQKICFSLLKMKSIFFQQGKSNLFDYLYRDYRNYFLNLM